VRAHYEVRNERAAYLRLSPPAGFRVIGVRVGGTTATPARAEDGGWIIPLLRSVETVQGLLSFPIEVILLGETEGWRRRERRMLALPVVDAPIAVSRLTLYLPPGYRSRKKPGEGDVVARFTRGEGITYGLGVGEVGAARADALFQDAVQSWLRNDFDAAQQKLDELRAMGAKNENMARLQSNLDVVSGKAISSQDLSLQRRVREQARARAYAEVQAQADLMKKAEEAKARGDYEEAASSYRQALDVGGKLAQLEQAESVEQKVTNAQIARYFADAQTMVETKRGIRRRTADTAEDKAAKAFAQDGITGAWVRPEGANSRAVTPDRDADGIADASDAVRALEEVRSGVNVAEEVPQTAPTIGGVTIDASMSTSPAPPPEPTADAPVERVQISVIRRANKPKRRIVPLRQRAGGPAAPPVRASPEPGMPTPVVHASALSVVVPAVGEPVLYQRLLLPAGAAYAVEIAAREPLLAKD
ncbi:MAG TPA: hypothetical protein VIK91_11375, partial [Nannocystis sp.]